MTDLLCDSPKGSPFNVWFLGFLREQQLAYHQLQRAYHQQAHELKYVKEQLRLMQSRQFGRKSEKSTSDQQQLLLPLFDESAGDEVDVTLEPVTDDKEKITYERRKPTPKNGRNIDTRALPRERVVHDLPEEEKVCGCGKALCAMGEDVSEQLDYIPAMIKVIEHVRLKYTCRDCDTVHAASKPEQPLPKALAGSSLMSDVVVKKYQDHLPLYRQSHMLKREGVDIPDVTLGNWVMKSAQLLEPVYEALWLQLKAVKYLQVDETPVTMLRPHRKGYMWVYHSPDGANRFASFEFSHTRSAQVPNQRLSAFNGILQTDGYSGYGGQRARSDVINLGCWDHVRRKFVEAVKVADSKKGVAGELLSRINKLYHLEKQIKAMPPPERLAVRQQESRPIIDGLLERARETLTLGKSTLGKALTYLLNQQTDLLEYTNHGHVNISNCWVENLIRPFAVGRNNWLFVGNQPCAQWAALWYSFIQTCKMNQVHPRGWIEYVLKRVHAVRRREIDPVTLLPQFIDKQKLIT